MLPTPTGLKRKNLKGLKLAPTSASTTAPSAADAQVPGGKANEYYLDQAIGTLEIGVEFKLDIKQEDLKTVAELGFGNGGTVSKVMHIPTKTLMAKKVIKIDAKPEARKRIHRELQIMHDCNSPSIIGFYGAFLNENDNDVHVCMEFMDCGSLDTIVKQGLITLSVLGKITYSVVEGLIYLYDVHRIIHRDVKPSNVLVNTLGRVKLCDFGVSGELINSIANTFVGTSTYMSPERIQGAQYSVKGDVWSLGLMLVELATGKFPFGSAKMGVLELLQLIVREPAPTLSSAEFPLLSEMIEQCLRKDPKERATLKDLLHSEFVNESKKKRVDMAAWAKSTQTYRSYAAPPPPPPISSSGTPITISNTATSANGKNKALPRRELDRMSMSASPVLRPKPPLQSRPSSLAIRPAPLQPAPGYPQ